jgi:hypothetical protein
VGHLIPSGDSGQLGRFDPFLFPCKRGWGGFAKSFASVKKVGSILSCFFAGDRILGLQIGQEWEKV